MRSMGPPSVDLRAISAIKEMVPVMRDSGLAYDCRSFRPEGACVGRSLYRMSRVHPSMALSNFPPDG
jgi:hypothetical protein